MTAIQCLKKYFEAEPHGRKVTMDEMKALSKEERAELSTLAAEALGVELTVATA